MGKPVSCPGGCGAVYDYDAVASYSPLRERSGKFCSTPGCGHPLDEETARKDVIERGPDSADAMENRAQAAKAFHEASATKTKTESAAK